VEVEQDGGGEHRGSPNVPEYPWNPIQGGNIIILPCSMCYITPLPQGHKSYSVAAQRVMNIG
jgi:hypothetical protein